MDMTSPQTGTCVSQDTPQKVFTESVSLWRPFPSKSCRITGRRGHITWTIARRRKTTDGQKRLIKRIRTGRRHRLAAPLMMLLRLIHLKSLSSRHRPWHCPMASPVGVGPAALSTHSVNLIQHLLSHPGTLLFQDRYPLRYLHLDITQCQQPQSVAAHHLPRCLHAPNLFVRPP